MQKVGLTLKQVLNPVLSNENLNPVVGRFISRKRWSNLPWDSEEWLLSSWYRSNFLFFVTIYDQFHNVWVTNVFPSVIHNSCYSYIILTQSNDCTVFLSILLIIIKYQPYWYVFDKGIRSSIFWRFVSLNWGSSLIWLIFQPLPILIISTTAKLICYRYDKTPLFSTNNPS